MSARPSPPLVVVMGVSGSGKSTVGRRLAAELALPFIEGDHFHDPEHLVRMGRGEPLTEDERQPWLGRLHDQLSRHVDSGGVLACSALTERSRHLLLDGLPDTWIVFLRGDPDLLRRRLRGRGARGVGPDLLDSQLATLEPPTSTSGVARVISLDVAAPVEELVSAALAEFRDAE